MLKRNSAHERTRQSLSQRFDVLINARHFWINLIGYPASERESACLHGIGSEQRMIQTTKPQADDQNDWQREHGGKIGSVMALIQWHSKSANAFHHDSVGALREFMKACLDRGQFN